MLASMRHGLRLAGAALRRPAATSLRGGCDGRCRSATNHHRDVSPRAFPRACRRASCRPSDFSSSAFYAGRIALALMGSMLGACIELLKFIFFIRCIPDWNSQPSGSLPWISPTSTPLSQSRKPAAFHGRRTPPPDPAGGEQAHRRAGSAAGCAPVRSAGPRRQSHRSWPRPAPRAYQILNVLDDTRRALTNLNGDIGGRLSRRPAITSACIGCRLCCAPLPARTRRSAGYPFSRFGSGL